MLQTGALLLDGGTLNYFGNKIPINLILAVVAEIVLVGGAEYYRIINGLVLHINITLPLVFLFFFFLNLIKICKKILVGFRGQASPRWSIWPTGVGKWSRPSSDIEGERDKEWKTSNVCDVGILFPSICNWRRSCWEPLQTPQWSFWQQFAYCSCWLSWESSYPLNSFSYY